MPKALSTILSGPIGLIDKRAGQIVSGIGLTVVGIASGNPLLVSLGSFQLNQAFAPRAPKPEATVTSLKSPTPPRVSAYGRVRLFWAYALYETASDGWAVDVGVFHDGRLDAVETYYIGDKPVTVLSGGWIQEGPAGEWGDGDSVRVGVRLGLPVETAFSEVVAKLPGIWTSDHRGDGCATGFMLSKNVKAENFQKIYATGGPNNATLSIVARAQRVFDWRDPTQSVADPSTWTWSENWVLHMAHYELVRVGKQPGLPPSDPGYAAELASLLQSRWARKIAPTLAYWTAAANDADIAVPLKAGGTEPRYRSCVAHKHTDSHKDVRAALLGCGDGWMTARADRALIIYSGRYYPPIVTIGPDEITSYSIQEGIEEEAAVNAIKLTYVSASHDFNTVDTDDWTDEGDISERGKMLAQPLENQVPSHSQARRLGKRAMARIMAAQRGTTTTNAAGRVAIGQRYIRQIIVEAGVTFQDAVVEVVAMKRNPQTGGVSYDWIRASLNIDAWNPATEEGEPAPIGDRVAREPLAAPEITGATVQFDDNGINARVLTTINGPDRDDLKWFLRWRVTSDAIWNEQEYSDIDGGASIALLTALLPVDVSIDLEVSFQVGDGRISPWSPLVPISTSTAGLAPAEASGFTVSPLGGAEAEATWVNPTSANLVAVRIYRATTNDFMAASPLGGDRPISGLGAPDMATLSSLPAGVTHFWITTISGAGTPSGPVHFGPVTIA